MGDGTLYDTFFTQKGDLYENWYDKESMKIIWSRHHSDHGYPKYHENPHDHQWYRDENGNWKPGPSLPPNPQFKSPTETNNGRTNGLSKMERAGAVAGGIAVGYIIYAGIKWTIAVIATPATGGGSLAVAGAMP